MTSGPDQSSERAFRSRPFQAGVFVVGVAGLWLIVLFASTHLPVDLTVLLLILLNWYLIPPYRTFEISNPDNVAALVVFALVAAISSLLVGASSRARSRMRTSESRAGIISDVVSTDESSSDALARVRDALELAELELLKLEGSRWISVATSDRTHAASDAFGSVALDVPIQQTYRLIGRGQELFAVDPGFVESLAAAVVRSYESEQLRIEQQRAVELEAIDQARTALLASVGHDLRTPLSSLRLAVDTLRSAESQLDDLSRAELLATVDDATGRLNEMITDMLDLSRLEAGVLLAQPEVVALDEVVAGATLAWPASIVSVDVSDDLPAVEADPVLLERVIENLVSNAIRHGGADANEPVRISASATDDHIELVIADRGPGLNGRHPTAQNPLTAGGTADASSGLGLAIVVAFTNAMNIPVDFSTTDGTGLAAILRLRPVKR